MCGGVCGGRAFFEQANSLRTRLVLWLDGRRKSIMDQVVEGIEENKSWLEQTPKTEPHAAAAAVDAASKE